MRSIPPAAGVADDARRSPVKVVRRAFLLLDLLTTAGGRLTLQQLTAQSELPVGTVHRLLQTLVHAGYVRQNASKVYSLGPQMIWVGGNAGRVLGSWARTELSKLVRATGETASLAILDGHQAIYVGQSPSTHNLRMLTELGRRVPLHSTAAGKALLASLPDAQVDRLISAATLKAMTPATITTADGLHAELRAIRDRGYATELGEHEIGVTALAVAVPGPDQLAVTVSGPSNRLSADIGPQLQPLMLEVATTLTRMSAADDLAPPPPGQR